MTASVRNGIKCQKCGTEIVCQCGHRVTASTPFSDWLRSLEGPLSSQYRDNQNLDYIWFAYLGRWFITIEEKRFGARSSLAQSDAHKIVAQMLNKASGSEVETLRGTRKITYKGHYIISFEKTSPTDSAWIRIIDVLNKRTLNNAGMMELLALLRWGRLVTRILTDEEQAYIIRQVS